MPMAAPYPSPAPITVDTIHPCASGNDRRRTSRWPPPIPSPTAAPDVIWMAAPPTATLIVGSITFPSCSPTHAASPKPSAAPTVVARIHACHRSDLRGNISSCDVPITSPMSAPNARTRTAPPATVASGRPGVPSSAVLTVAPTAPPSVVAPIHRTGPPSGLNASPAIERMQLRPRVVLEIEGVPPLQPDVLADAGQRAGEWIGIRGARADGLGLHRREPAHRLDDQVATLLEVASVQESRVGIVEAYVQMHVPVSLGGARHHRTDNANTRRDGLQARRPIHVAILIGRLAGRRDADGHDRARRLIRRAAADADEDHESERDGSAQGRASAPLVADRGSRTASR